MTGTVILPEKALSIQQPWASLIITGNKLVENRTWNTKWRGTLAIHAGKKIARHDADSLAAEFGIKPPLVTGYLGTADLVGVHPEAGARCCGIWAETSERAGRPVFHWLLDNPQALPEPIQAKGMLGLFTPHQGINWGNR